MRPVSYRPTAWRLGLDERRSGVLTLFMWLYLPLLLLVLVTASGAFVRWHAQLFVHFLACFIDARARARDDDERMTLLSIETHVACCPTNALEAVAQAATADEMTKALRPANLTALSSSRSSSEQLIHQFAQSSVPLSSLPVQLLADVITALEPVASSRLVAAFISDCLCSTMDEDCFTLKAMVDDRVSLRGMVCGKISDVGVREAILTHFQAQAQRSSDSILPLSLIFNGESAMSPGFSSQSPIVPGLRQFVHEVTTRDASRLKFSGRVVVLTGHKRPDQRTLEQALGCKCTVIQDPPRSRFGLRRAQVDHIGELIRLFPECRYVLIDSTSQDNDDQERRLLRLDGRTITLIHQAADKDEATRSDKESLRFQTYMGAIFQLFQCGSVPPEAVGRVVGATLSEARSIQFLSQQQHRSVTRQLMADMGAIMEQLSMDDASSVLYASVPQSRR